METKEVVKKEAVKRNQSSMQVLKTLQLLLEDNYTMTELIQKLNKNEKELAVFADLKFQRFITNILLPVFRSGLICLLASWI